LAQGRVRQRPAPCQRNGSSNRSNVCPLALNNFSRTAPGMRLSCCVAVLDDQNLVIVSARGNLSPLLELAESRH
jgi:hypothetical protein